MLVSMRATPASYIHVLLLRPALAALTLPLRETGHYRACRRSCVLYAYCRARFPIMFLSPQQERTFQMASMQVHGVLEVYIHAAWLPMLYL